MTPLGWLISAGLVLVAIFAVANWTLLTASATLNFLLFSVEGPFALILFGAIVVFAALFAVYGLSLRTTALLETRRHLKDLEAQRQIADNAEASRLAALTAQIERDFAAVRSALDTLRVDTRARADELEQGLARRLDETGNALFAHVGQIDDKLNRMRDDAAPPGGGAPDPSRRLLR